MNRKGAGLLTFLVVGFSLVFLALAAPVVTGIFDAVAGSYNSNISLILFITLPLLTGVLLFKLVFSGD